MAWMSDSEVVLEQTRQSWNAVVPVHSSHRPRQAAFLATGGSTLFPEESALLGPVAGRSVLHLLCNTGQDSLSLAAAGAEVTGVDISDEAIAAGRRLSQETGIAARFERAEVIDWLTTAARAGNSYDIAFASYGAACWLRNLAEFAAALAAVVRPGGRFVLVDFHPVAAIFDAQWRHREPYPQNGTQLDLDGVGDYVGAAAGGLSPGGFAPGVDEFRNPHACTLYRWGLGDVVTAFAAAPWSVRRLEEYPFANGERQFDRMRTLPGRRLAPPHDVPSVPLMYGLLAGRNLGAAIEPVSADGGL
jgi:SAM-dependent methyltransferase